MPQKVLTTENYLSEDCPYIIIDVGTINFIGQDFFIVRANRGKELMPGLTLTGGLRPFIHDHSLTNKTEYFLFPLQEHYVHELRYLCENSEDWYPRIGHFPFTLLNVIDTDDDLCINIHLHSDIHSI